MTLIKDSLVQETVKIVEKHGTDRKHLMDIVREVQATFGCISDKAIDSIAREMGIHRVEVAGVVSFYHFLSEKRKGRTTIWLSKGAVPSINVANDVAKVLVEKVGKGFGEGCADDPIGLEWTSCIGMSDQEPAALINGIVFTNLTVDKTNKIVDHIARGGNPAELVTEHGDGNNASPLIHSMVNNNIRRIGDVILAERETGSAVRKLVKMQPSEVIDEIKKSNLRGRGGAGFPTGLKWDFTVRGGSAPRYVVCNGDEGEPGTFKDRVIFTERAELLFEGMTVAGYAIGAEEGILYLRGEYEYLRRYLENVLNKMREANLLGENIAGREGFNFDIHIQMGAGAYICGEESALIESAEGKRGDPRDRPPYPPTKGYMNRPTAVNNVETLCAAAKIIEKDAPWFSSFGTEKSSGTKLLSISGDCKYPGVYEFPFGITLNELLKEVGAENTYAVQVGGPSGKCVGEKDFGRKVAFEDLATGGAMIIINKSRDLFKVVEDFMDFFVDESCGYCTPCRVGNLLMRNRLTKIREGRGTKSDIEFMKTLGHTVSVMSRCGLGLTSCNPVTSTIENFPEIYESKLTNLEFVSPHDLHKAVEYGREVAKFK